MAEAKQTNFRINQEAADAFRKYCEENGWNQAQGFDHLIEILELNQAKATMPNQSTDIEQFEMYQKKMLEAFLHNLSITAETEERIREEFRTALDQKDQTIRDLQDKTAAQAAEVDQAKAVSADAEKALTAAEKEAEQARKDADAAQSLAAEKGRTNDMLTSKLTEAEEKLSGYDDLRKTAEDLKAQVTDLSRQLDFEKRAAADAQKDADRKLSDAAKDAELHEIKALDSLRAEFNEQIQKLREEKAGLQARLAVLEDQAGKKN